MGKTLKSIKGKTYKVVITASNGKTKTYKVKGNFDVYFNSLEPSVKTNYILKQKDLDYINNELIPQGISAYEARIFVVGGRNSTIVSTPMDGRSGLAKTLDDFNWGKAYQFIMTNATQDDVKNYFIG